MAAGGFRFVHHERGQRCQDPTLAVSHDVGLRFGQAFEHGCLGRKMFPKHIDQFRELSVHTRRFVVMGRGAHPCDSRS